MSANIGVIVLAAGAGSRFKQSGGVGPKQLTPINGKPMLQHSIDLANRLLPGAVHLVLGCDWESIVGQIVHDEIIVNPDWQRGLGGSIAYAVQQLQAGPFCYDALLVMLGDQPYVRQPALTQMIDGYLAASDSPCCCGDYAGHAGVPAIFPAALFSRLMSLHGDAGAKSLLASLDNKIMIPRPEAAIDIDVVDDLKRLVN